MTRLDASWPSSLADCAREFDSNCRVRRVWPAMIRHVLGHHKRILVAPPDQIAHVAWDDIQPLTYHDYATAAQSLHQLGDVL